MEVLSHVNNLQDYARNLKDTRLSSLKHPQEFFNIRQMSRPADMQEYMKRASYNIRYFSANYAIVVALLAVYSLLTNFLLLISLGFLIGGFLAISRYGKLLLAWPKAVLMAVQEPIEFAGKTITPQNLYTALFVIGIPMLWIAAPLSTVFWIVGSSACVVGAHAGIMEPGIESEYGAVETV